VIDCPNLDFFDVTCSDKRHFEKLFSGEVMAPMGLWFSKVGNIKFAMADIFSLPAIRDAKNLKFNATSSDSYESFCAPLAATHVIGPGPLLNFLHTPYPGIPEHIRRKRFNECRFASMLHNRATLTENTAVGLLKDLPGRFVQIDLQYLGAGALAKLIRGCRERFDRATSRCAYLVLVICPVDGGQRLMSRDDYSLINSFVQDNGDDTKRYVNAQTRESLTIGVDFKDFRAFVGVPDAERNQNTTILLQLVRIALPDE